MKYGVMEFGAILEFCIITYYLFTMLECRYERKKTFLLYSLIIIPIFLLSPLLIEMPVLKMIVSVIGTIICFSFFKDKLSRKLIVFSVHYFCAFMAELTSMAIVVFVTDTNYFVDFKTDNSVFVKTALLTYSFMTVYDILGILFLKRKSLTCSGRLSQYIILYVVFQFIMGGMIGLVSVQYSKIKLPMIFIIMLVAGLSFMVGILVYRSASALARENAEAEFIKKEAKLRDKQFKEIKSQYSELRKIRHDFYNHIKIIDMINDPLKAKEYNSELKKQFDSMTQKSFCDNLTVDALLNLKYNEAMAEGIRTNFKVCDIGDINIKDFDLCTILSNLLDNGIEASANTSNKYIDLEIKRKMGRIVITMKNSSNPVKADFTTTKADKLNHGIGLVNIDEALKNYDGDRIFKYNDGEFLSVLNMSCKA